MFYNFTGEREQRNWPQFTCLVGFVTFGIGITVPVFHLSRKKTRGHGAV